MTIKRTLAFVAIAAAFGFGTIVATRVDGSAISAILGAVCALAFGVPATALITAGVIHYRQRQRRTRQHEHRRYVAPQPPVVVVAPPTQAPQFGYPAWSGGGSPELPARRQFSVIGEEGEE